MDWITMSSYAIDGAIIGAVDIPLSPGLKRIRVALRGNCSASYDSANANNTIFHSQVAGDPQLEREYIGYSQTLHLFVNPGCTVRVMIDTPLQQENKK